MQYIIMIVLAGIILVLAVFLLVQRKREAVLQIQLKRLKEQLDKLKIDCAETERERESFLQAANTIYLYAALSEEEAQSSSLKEKQTEILRASESIIRTIQI